MTSRQLLIGSWADAWRPRPNVDRAEWCHDNLRLPAESSASPGLMDLTRYSYARSVLEAADDPNVEIIVLCWATQLGKTTVALAILLSQVALSPVPSMLICPDKDELLSTRDKLYAMSEVTVPLQTLTPPAHLRNNRWVDLGSMRTYLAYPFNTQRLSGKSCALVVGCEVDRFRARKQQGDPLELAKQRTKAFYESTTLFESSPTDDKSRIWKLLLQSDQRRFLLPCPRCNHHQELRLFVHRDGPFAGAGGISPLKDSRGNWRPAEDVRQDAHYICERGCKIENDSKAAMVAAGQWVPKGQSIDKHGKLAGTPERGPRIWGSQLSSLYADTISFGRFAGEYLDSRDDPEKLQVYTNTWRGIKWQQKPKTPEWEALGRRLRGNHPRGTVPAGASFLTAGVDVGADYTRWVVRAWGEGSTSWLVDRGTTRARVAPDGSLSRDSHLRALDDELLSRLFPVVGSQRQMTIRLLGIDCGYKPRLVHAWARRHKRGRVYTVAGMREIKGGEFFRCQTVEKDARTGKPYPGGLQRWEINRGLYNPDLVERWKAPLDEPGAWYLADEPPDQAEEYLRELVNEAPKKERNKHGREVTVWEIVERGIGNHSWDAEVYALALADMVTGGDWDNLAQRAKPKRSGSRRRERQTNHPSSPAPYGRLRE